MLNIQKIRLMNSLQDKIIMKIKDLKEFNLLKHLFNKKKHFNLK